jgi:plastocyanin
MTAVRSLTITIIALLVGALPSAATPPQLLITIENGAPYFLPVSATVAAGTSIRWDNPTATHHTITHDSCVGGDVCAFDSGNMAPNESYTLPGLSPGQYPYHCRVHPVMRGVLTITEPAVAPVQA